MNRPKLIVQLALQKKEGARNISEGRETSCDAKTIPGNSLESVRVKKFMSDNDDSTYHQGASTSELLPSEVEINMDETEAEGRNLRYIIDDDDSSNEQATSTPAEECGGTVENVEAGEYIYAYSNQVDETNVGELINTPCTSITSGKKGIVKQIRKKHYCLFCKTIQTNIVRHIAKMHRNEPLVKEALEGDSKKKNEIMEHLRKQGDLCYNKTVSNQEAIIPVCNYSSGMRERLACPLCGGFYSKRHLSSHLKTRCSKRSEDGMMRSNIIGEAKVAGIAVLKIASPKLIQSIFPTIRDPEILKVAAQDEAIILYANRLIDGYYQEGTQKESNPHFNYIASKIRLLAKLLNAIRAIDTNVSNLREVFAPKFYHTVVKAIKQLGGYKDGQFRAPSTATNCCTLLGHVANCLRIQAIVDENKPDQKRVQNFMLLMRDRQNIDITKMANETRAAGQRSKNLTLPTTREVKEFLHELMKELESVFVSLGENFESKTYQKASQLCLVYIMAFNRKRPGDCEKSRIVEWSNMATVSDELIERLNETERQYALDFGIFVTQGKLNKKCSIIVPKKIRIIIDDLLKGREDPEVAKILNIATTNPYVFAAPIGRKYPYLKAEQCLNIFCRNKQFDFSKFKANMLRKHLATSTSTLPYERQRIVSDFMGHGMEIHNNIYKQRQVQVDCINIGEILFASGDLLQQSTAFVLTADSSRTLEPQPGPSHQTTSHERQSRELLDDSDFQPSPSLEPHPGSSRQNEEPGTSSTRRRLFPQVLNKKRTWTTQEKNIVRASFRANFDGHTIPSLAQIEEARNSTRLRSINRTSQQVRKWIEHQQKLKKSGTISWGTPQRKKCRRVFNEYYEGQRMNIYPSIGEIQAAINEHPEFSGKTVNQIRSHIQHDIKYLRRPERRNLNFD